VWIRVGTLLNASTFIDYAAAEPNARLLLVLVVVN